ncbi:Peptidylprolyl isomerase [Spironucleus salmonicida]|uniref:peptidylprolyl isomerase n=1 Tax=Spironucleus salmonicida TaxID=348837 RepID=V6LUW7_9EUKA|nr:Peptidylprolyl isomerase [Spironucleus salmonicida]|eukprot:EST48043.1 FKBP-type peptidyl-prolyl cis-trans isomerase [Spironucleus salmonicida]
MLLFLYFEFRVEILEKGDGITYASEEDRVTYHYTSFMENGTQFASSHDYKIPSETDIGCPLTIQGLNIGLTKVSLNEKARIYIPWNMAYGDKHVGVLVPQSNIYIDVEIKKIEFGSENDANQYSEL